LIGLQAHSDSPGGTWATNVSLSLNMSAVILELVSRWAPARRLLWRTGRAMYAAGRRDLANSPEVNGEYWLLRRAIEDARPEDVFLDVGANIGNWSAQCVRLGALRRGCRVHAFEPCPETYIQLNARLGDELQTHRLALGETPGTAEFYEVEHLGGTNSLHPTQGAKAHLVCTDTVDNVRSRLGEAPVKFMKVDTEGFDLKVLRGAASSLKNGAIEVVQIEYNWRWLLNNASLRDLFCFTESLPYRVGKLAGDTIEVYEAWHPELDRFFESNFVLLRQGSALESLGTAMKFDRTNVGRRTIP
jgi:FkbM family methyltransferase